MQNLSFKRILIFISLLFLPGIVIFGQNPPEMPPRGDPNTPPPKAMERISSLKKVKLLEVLNLSESEADKFLVKYNSYEKDIQNKMKSLEEKSRELHQAINSKSKDLEKITREYISLKTDLDNTVNQKLMDMKNYLTTEQYAKYLLFERNFQNELRKSVMRQVNKNQQKKGQN